MAGAIARGEVGGRLWFYANYHCNLRCTYCLTESAPEVTRRELGREQIVERAREGRELGFTALGVTGGEPFVLEYMPELIAALGSELPTIVLSNATVFNDRRLREMEPLADLPVQVQISLGRPDPDDNDAMRGPENFRKVVEAVPKLVERGIGCWPGSSSSSPSSRLRPTERSTAPSPLRSEAASSTPTCSSRGPPSPFENRRRCWPESPGAARRATTPRSASGERDLCRPVGRRRQQPGAKPVGVQRGMVATTRL
jgi:hypothetical protein